MKRRWLATLALAAPLLSACVTQSGSPLPEGTLAQGLAAGITAPNTPPPGSNIAGCTPSSAHPYPVVLVHATMINMDFNWQALSPMLYNAGYCVYAFNYGATPSGLGIFDGLGDIATSAQQLATEVNSVLATTGASQVDIVGHSQGGMMPRYYIQDLGGASKVHELVGIAPSNYGTTLDGLASLANALGGLGFNVNSLVSSLGGPALTEQEQGSAFLTALNANGDTVPGVKYVVIESDHDEVVTPYTNAFLKGPGAQNILVQDQCPSDPVGHIGMVYDQTVLDDVMNALGTDSPTYQPPCNSSGFGVPV